MFEKRLLEISKSFDHNKKEKYFILTHKKHKREIYFQNNKKTILFIKDKFGSFKKRLVYFFIKIKILQPFLKKIYLNKKIGDAILVAGQIKGFNLNEKTVLSFSKQSDENALFIKSKEYQKKMANSGFAPKILKINKQIPFSIEELLSASDENNFKIFEKLVEYYMNVKIKKVLSEKFVSVLAKKIKNKKIKKLLQEISIRNTTLLISQVHGDFAKEQILKKNDKIVFIDWNAHPGLIIEDIVNFFCGEEDFLKNKEFLFLLKLYPNEVQRNISDYLILNEIIRISNDKKNLPLAKIRIRKLLSKNN